MLSYDVASESVITSYDNPTSGLNIQITLISFVTLYVDVHKNVTFSNGKIMTF